MFRQINLSCNIENQMFFCKYCVKCKVIIVIVNYYTTYLKKKPEKKFCIYYK